MNFNYRPINTNAVREQLARNGSGMDQVQKFEDNTKLFFYLLPPWEGSEVLGKEIWECWGLPAIRDKKWFRHIAWKTWEGEEPGISKLDPIMAVLEGLKGNEIVQKMMPSAKFQLNVIYTGLVRLNKDGTPIESSYVEEKVPSTRIIAIPSAAFNAIMKHVVSAELSQQGSLVNPLASAMFGIAKVNDGKKTRYNTEIIGSVTPKGIVPNRYNLIQLYSEPVVEKWYTSIANLNKRNPSPSESQRIEAQLNARAIHEAILHLIADSNAPPVQRAYDGSIRKNTPEAVVAPKTVAETVAPPPSPVVDQSGPVTVPTSQVCTAAPVPLVPETSPPAESAGGISPKDILTKDLGLAEAPKTPEGLPLCFRRITKVQASPNAKWCESCTWRLPCKASQGTGT